MNFLTKVLFLGFAVGCALASDELVGDVSEDVKLDKRGFIQFYRLIREFTKRDPTDYWNYGCWCGLGGKGTPLDETDRCCKEHDLCFNQLTRSRICGRYEVYRKNYYHTGLKCYTGWWSSRCGRGICKCDVAAVKCFRRSRFNKSYRKYKKSQC
ncbi:phospholipase A2 A2-actitoxin-Cgg2a [Exaiptasia diaphana]|uniref:Phospholipase A2 n=1 Tax=Exaiptasia diaphana TaxID=2652724 RepID=A0A913X833_EXADI|nr:phospholipase A2 A2-actitoxin-Cgg2a [Exaiptasia diaphana]KXJ14279.1 Phospholipase A2 [Exaiptasia diaphana]